MEEKRPRGRPATGVTPKRNIRVGDVWDQAEEYAKTDGENMAQLVTHLLHGYVAHKKAEQPEPDA